MAQTTMIPTTFGPIAYGEAGDGPAILLLHAFPMAGEMWLPQVAALKNQYRVVVPDLFGFGATPLPEKSWSISLAAQAMAELIDELALDPVVVMGLSMGGYVALQLAHLFPDKVSGLILADTKADADSAEAKSSRDKAIVAVAAGGPSAQVEAMLPKVLGKTTHDIRPGVVSEFRAIGTAQSSEGVIAGLRALRDRDSAVPFLAKINIPTLVIVGEEDELTPLADAQKLAAGIPNAQIAIIPNAGHLSNLESPEAYNEHVLGFLKTLADAGK